MLFMGVAGCGVIAWSAAEDYNWNRAKPVWWLATEMDSSKAAVVDAARTELVRRLVGNDLSRSQIASLLDRFLAVHADPQARWTDDVSRFIEVAREHGDVDDATFGEYLMAAVAANVSVQSRDRVRQGRPVPLYVRSGPNRVTRDFHSRVTGQEYYCSFPVLRIAERKGERLWTRGPRSAWAGGIEITGGSGGGTRRKFDLDLPIGMHELVYTVQTSIFLIASGARITDDTDPLQRWTEDFFVTIEIVPPDMDIVRTVDDPTLADAIRKSIIVDFIHDNVDGVRGSYGHVDTPGLIMIEYPPIDVAFEVLGRTKDGRVERLCLRASKRDRKAGYWLYPSVHEVFPNEETIDVIFRSNQDAASENIDLEEIWSGEIIFEDVPVQKTANDGE